MNIKKQYTVEVRADGGCILRKGLISLNHSALFTIWKRSPNKSLKVEFAGKLSTIKPLIGWMVEGDGSPLIQHYMPEYLRAIDTAAAWNQEAAEAAQEIEDCLKRGIPVEICHTTTKNYLLDL